MVKLVDKLSETKMLGAALSVFATLALWLTAMNINAACMYIAHEIELPEEAKSMRKF